MKNIIFYFSGTGNSFAVATHIANTLKDTEVVHITNLENTFENGTVYERIGFVFPVYYNHMPNIMKEFLGKVQYKQEQYIFGVDTYGGNSGMAMGDLREKINECGGKLRSEFGVRMPGNYIVEYGAFPKLICDYLYKKEQRKILKISSKIKRKETTDIIKPSFIAKLFSQKAINEVKKFKDKDKEFNVNDNCTNCKICKNICPANSIEILEDKPIWKNNCEQCMACIQWCPVQAINYSNKTQTRKRYTHPEVKVMDIIQK
jgi:ferredoxin/flavodoxin